MPEEKTENIKSQTESPFAKMTNEEVLKNLDVDAEKGLTSSEAKARLEKYGPNALEEKKRSIFKQLLVFFWGPIPWMIEIAAILSGVLQKWPDFIVIMAMLIINAALGFFQEFKAGNAIEALKKKLALHARALRDGKWVDILAKEIVPGDIIGVKLGNIIPADLKLVSGEYLTVDQSALTGESLPVTKKKQDIAFSGTIAKTGEMNGVVTETGMNTFFGKTAKLVSEAKTKSHFQQAVIRIGDFLIFLTLTICAIILVVSLYRIEIEHVLHESLGQIVIFILVLVIAGIPIALPAVLSATMAIGAGRLAKMKAIVSKLTAVEEMANMDILCSDKTGTLTKNELTVGDIQLFESKDPNEVLTIACLASNPDGRDAIDEAIFKKLENKDVLNEYMREKFTPFDPVIKKAVAVVKQKDGTTIQAAKGAPQVILKMVEESEDLSQKVMSAIEVFAAKGYRTLGVAKTDQNGKWHYLGLLPMFDPPRDDTKETLGYIKGMGIDVKMVTGDHEAIAKELSVKLDLGSNIISVTELEKRQAEEEKNENNKDNIFEEANGFAQVYPQHKFDIVKALQHKGHITGMTGDGVNDAPALKQADIGIAVSGATDAAKEAADIVLTEPGLLVIAHAVEQSRKIFNRMKSYAMYRISETCRLLLFLLLSMLVFNDHPLTAIMIILIALLNDVPIMMIAYDRMPIDKNPSSWNMKEILTIAIGLAIAGVISTFGLYWIGDHYWFASITDATIKFYHLRTLAFMGILCGGNLTIYLTRNTRAIWSKPHPEIKFFLATLVSQIIGTGLSVYGIGTNDFVGIGWKYVAFSWAYILVWFLICMLVKEGLYKIIGRKTHYIASAIKHAEEKMHLQ
ncbi:MAG: Calcium-transporting ATPase 1 [Candidatus Anoxychlamydiales bacterium]|nr:Calcium-transporting ATPase 1 [Candidatus Anoxychlamydiales bacterium]